MILYSSLPSSSVWRSVSSVSLLDSTALRHAGSPSSHITSELRYVLMASYSTAGSSLSSRLVKWSCHPYTQQQIWMSLFQKMNRAFRGCFHRCVQCRKLNKVWRACDSQVSVSVLHFSGLVSMEETLIICVSNVYILAWLLVYLTKETFYINLYNCAYNSHKTQISFHSFMNSFIFINCFILVMFAVDLASVPGRLAWGEIIPVMRWQSITPHLFTPVL